MKIVRTAHRWKCRKALVLVSYAPLPPSLGCFEKRVVIKVARYVGLLLLCTVSPPRGCGEGSQHTTDLGPWSFWAVHDALCLQAARVRQDFSKTDQIRLERRLPRSTGPSRPWRSSASDIYMYSSRVESRRVAHDTTLQERECLWLKSWKSRGNPASISELSERPTFPLKKAQPRVKSRACLSDFYLPSKMEIEPRH
jgi:hypothetical protein